TSAIVGYRVILLNLWQSFDRVAVADAALQDRIEQFHGEAGGGANAADGANRTTNHAGVFRQCGFAAGQTQDQVLWRAQAGQRTLLIERLGVVLVNPGADDQLIPMISNLGKGP